MFCEGTVSIKVLVSRHLRESQTLVVIELVAVLVVVLVVAALAVLVVVLLVVAALAVLAAVLLVAQALHRH